jgi:AcrR family transcriptional regulator
MPAREENRIDRRPAIVAAAIKLADREGLDAVSMRRIAEQLGLGTMTLYSHVADKSDLIDLMCEEVSRAMLVPEPLPEDWRAALKAIGVHTRDAIAPHAWIGQARARRTRVGLNTMRHVEQSIQAVSGLDIEPPTGGAILTAVDDYVIGHTLRARSRERLAGRVVKGALTDDPEVAAAIQAGELPLLSVAIATGADPGGGLPPRADFERGLDWLLDGIAADLGLD